MKTAKIEANGAVLNIPNGVLAEGVEVEVAEGSEIANDTMGSFLDLPPGTKSAGPSVNISATGDVSPEDVGKLQIEISYDSAIELALAQTNLVVIYMVKTPEGKTRLGIIPQNKLTISEKKLGFVLLGFGNYQPAIIPIFIDEGKTVEKTAAEIPILAKSSGPLMEISQLRPLVIDKNDEITVHGKNLRASLVFSIGDTLIPTTSIQADTALLTFPEAIPFGIHTMKAQQDGHEVLIKVFATADKSDHPIMTELPAQICTAVQFYNAEGTLTQGTKNCTTGANCSSDSQTNCRTTTNYPAADISGIASKIISGNTIAGVAGTAPSAEAHIDCTGGSQSNCITTSSYKSMDLSSAGTYTGLTAANYSALLGKSDSFEFWDAQGARHSTALPGCGATGGVWVLVPGDTDYRSKPFCMMKYEAKCTIADGLTCTASAGSESPTSSVANTPWVSIGMHDSITECASLGKGYHLMSNEEWMSAAANIAALTSNWSGGSLGNGYLFAGHSDGDPNNSCAADANDALPFVEGTCTAIAASGGENDETTQRRTHNMSNGEVLWDMAGNVHDWVSYYNGTAKPGNSDSFHEYTALTPTTSMPLKYFVPTNGIKSSWSDSWNMTQKIGKYYPSSASSKGSHMRGAAWGAAANVGLFNFQTQTPEYPSTDIGFRCARSLYGT